MSYPIPSSGEEPPPLKKKASLLLFPQTTISSLPDDLILSCLARVSRLYYPTLSLVSKNFRRLLASPEIYKARSLLGRTESCLYVCLSAPDPRWFILCLKPNAKKKKKKKKKSFGYVLTTVPIPPSPRTGVLVAVGSNIYSIGEYFRPSSSVSILDCRSHTWHKAPSLRAERRFLHANVCDGKIYVVGGCQNKKDSSNWMEVYDPNTQTWESVLCPVAEKCIRDIDRSAVIDGEIFMCEYDGRGLAYKPKEDRWTSVGVMASMVERMRWHLHCVIDNILYCYDRQQGGIIWYDSNVGSWVKVIGLKGLPIIPYSYVRFVCYGGKIAVLWLKTKPYTGGDYRTVSCAVIALEKRNNNEIWGNVESIDEDVLTVSMSCYFGPAITATI